MRAEIGKGPFPALSGQSIMQKLCPKSSPDLQEKTFDSSGFFANATPHGFSRKANHSGKRPEAIQNECLLALCYIDDPGHVQQSRTETTICTTLTPSVMNSRMSQC